MASKPLWPPGHRCLRHSPKPLRASRRTLLTATGAAGLGLLGTGASAAAATTGAATADVGILAALLEPSTRCYLVDSDPVAVDVARRNAALNGAPNASGHLSDVLAALLNSKEFLLRK